ncbi:hypothetical protein PGTUg99_011884 [Puccinia graminis f. sp. tritici]|uniref:Uncharacterized protein n=1 Tax=Puccinia graminis f. sp. tritici TaxID=56615 RepID=A0A5B0N8V7_PUCGR|nr:hypothetical protein PGTUg99_011884 [Puccinia graminis f. sp. tritici]
MFHWDLSIRAVTFVADNPHLGPNNLYRAPDLTPWRCTGGIIEPIYNIKMNVHTPAPMEQYPTLRSWLTFEGPITSITPTGTINIHVTSSKYHSEIPTNYCAPAIEICGHVVKTESDTGSHWTASSTTVPY